MQIHRQNYNWDFKHAREEGKLGDTEVRKAERNSNDGDAENQPKTYRLCFQGVKPLRNTGPSNHLFA